MSVAAASPAGQALYTRFTRVPNTPERKATIKSEVARLRAMIRVISKRMDLSKAIYAALETQVDPWQKVIRLNRDLGQVLDAVENHLDGNQIQGTLDIINNAQYYQSLCPVTTYLQALGDCLTLLNVEGPTTGMGTVTSLVHAAQKLDADLQLVLKAAKIGGTGAFGLAPCLHFREMNKRFRVAATVSRYKSLQGLQEFANNHRIRKFETMPDDAKKTLQALEAAGEAIVNASKPPTSLPEGFTVIFVDGTNVTVTTAGVYKPACRIDWLRFNISRPPEAVEAEKLQDIAGRQSRIPPTACAEFDMEAMIHKDPDPTHPPRQGRPILGAHKKSVSTVTMGEPDNAARMAQKAVKASDPRAVQQLPPGPVTPSQVRKSKAQSQSPERPATSSMTPLPVQRTTSISNETILPRR